MIEMSVSGDGAKRFVEKMASRLMQAGDPHSGVDEQVAVAPPHMPDVALHDPDDMRLPDPCDAI